MPYIDGFVTPVLPGRREDYVAFARHTARMLHEHGALGVTECLGSDVPHGSETDLHRAVKAADGEEIALSWIVWPDKAARDAAWARIMEDERMQGVPDLPFDGRRMIFGGFDVVLDTADPAWDRDGGEGA